MTVITRLDRTIRTITYDPSPKWVRAVAAGVTVVDSRRAVLVWEPDRVLPVYAVPRPDLAECLVASTDPPTGIHGGASVYWTLRIGDLERADVGWEYPGEELAGYVALSWDGFDHWYEEDEEVFVHPRSPYTRVDALRTSRHVRVSLAGHVLGETDHAVVVFEGQLPPRYYLPDADVRRELLVPTSLHTACPYKGTASYWSVRLDGTLHDNVAWAYPHPLPGLEQLQGRVAFLNEVVDLVVDGQPLGRPATQWSHGLRDNVAGGGSGALQEVHSPSDFSVSRSRDT